MILFALGLAVVAAIAFAIYAGKGRQAIIANAENVMDELFDGSPQVTYKVAYDVGLPLETLTAGAGERGYRFSQTVQESKHVQIHFFDKA